MIPHWHYGDRVEFHYWPFSPDATAMTSNAARWILQVLAFGWAWSLCVSPCSAVLPAGQLDKILKDWETLQAPRNVRYVAVGTRWESSFYDGLHGVSIPVPPAEVNQPVKVVIVLDFANNRLRAEEYTKEWHWQDQQVHPRGTIEVCKDGLVTTKNFGADEIPGADSAHATLTIQRMMQGRRESGILNTFPFAMLSHGDVPTGAEDVDAKALRIAIKKQAFQLHGRGRHAGKECLIVRVKNPSAGTAPFAGPYRELWVDPAHGSAVLRVIDRDAAHILHYVEVDYRDGPGRPIPTATRFTSYSRGGKGAADYKYDLDIKEVSFDVELEESFFEIGLRPGMKVDKMMNSFKVAEDGKTLEPIPLMISYNDVPTFPVHQAARWGGMAFGIACLATLGWVLFRLTRKQSAD